VTPLQGLLGNSLSLDWSLAENCRRGREKCLGLETRGGQRWLGVTTRAILRLPGAIFAASRVPSPPSLSPAGARTSTSRESRKRGGPGWVNGGTDRCILKQIAASRTCPAWAVRPGEHVTQAGKEGHPSWERASLPPWSGGGLDGARSVCAWVEW
jgi:hypothetical protein